MLAVVVSRADRASVHVGEHLRDVADCRTESDDSRPDGAGGGTIYRASGMELREFDDVHVELDGVAGAFDDPDLLVFASRHSGETGPLLTAHHTGNFGPADHGGESDSLARACPNAHDRVLAALAEHAPGGYEVGTECTHHGPSDVGTPSMFVEVGSDPAQWDDSNAAAAVARAILDLRDVPPDAPPEEPADGGKAVEADADAHRRHLVGLGGGHYAPRFERIARETDWAVGHVAADWALAAMGDPGDHREVLAEAFAASAADHAVVAGDRPDLTATVEDLGHRVVSETWVRAVEGVPLPLVDRLESALCPVEAGLRFGTPAREAGPGVEFEAVPLPDDLIAAARGVDSAGTRAAVEATTLAFETTEGGTRAAGRAAVPGSGAHDRLVDRLVALLERDADAVERQEGAVVVHETTFDPEKARTLGVPEGPAFGRLAEGDPVEVDGRTITPETVRSERVRRFPLPAERQG